MVAAEHQTEEHADQTANGHAQPEGAAAVQGGERPNSAKAGTDKASHTTRRDQFM